MNDFDHYADTKKERHRKASKKYRKNLRFYLT